MSRGSRSQLAYRRMASVPPLVCLSTKVGKRSIRVKRSISGGNDLATVMKLKDFVSNTLPRARKQKRYPRNDKVCVPRSTQTDDVDSTMDSMANAYVTNESCSQDPVSRETAQQTNLWLSKFPDGGFDFDAEINTDPRSEHFSQEGVFEYDSDGGCILPKGRSRIKTNPWLPSPKSSPTTSGMTSPLAASSEVESQDQSGVFDFVRSDPFRANQSLFSPSASMTESGFYSCGTPDISTYEELHPKHFLFDNQRSISTDCESNDSEINLSLSSYPKEENPLALDQRDEVYLEELEQVQSPIDFHYEEVFEANVERCDAESVQSCDNLQNAFASRDLLESIYDETTADAYSPTDVQMEGGFQNYYDFNSTTRLFSDCDNNYGDNIVGVYRPAQNNEAISLGNEPDVDFCKYDNTQYDLDLEEFDPAPQRGSVSSQSSSRTISSEIYNHERNVEPGKLVLPLTSSDNERLEYLAYLDHCAERENSPNPSHFTASDYSKYLRSKKSTFDTMCGNLQDKIRRLRRDKVLIDDLVRKAREEEELKQAERMRMQREANLAMKQVLLDTLRDLKARLCNQTDRLQNSYEQILTFQYEDAKRK